VDSSNSGFHRDHASILDRRFVEMYIERGTCPQSSGDHFVKRSLFLIVGIASVVFLGIVILFRPGGGSPDTVVPPEPEEQLELYLSDNMDYSLNFSRVLTERRIANARRIAERNPELRTRALVVIDSLQARLDRTAE